jgi:hypothetical protein
VALLATSFAVAPTTFAACLTLASHPDGLRLAALALPAGDASFAITYVHSVTRTPVLERYEIAGGEIVETELRFEQHGPGLPTEADAGGTFTRSVEGFIVTMNRRFPAFVMQVHADQTPRLVVGARAMDLAQWGNRALALGVSDACAAP